MPVPPSAFPELPALAEGLTAVFRDVGPVTIVARAPNRQVSTAASDVITCRLGDGRELRLLCKYGGPPARSHGYRGGVPYEAVVYETVLRPAAVPTAQFHGAYESPAGETWLVLEFLDRAVRLTHSADPGVHRAAARWIGRFHALTAARLANEPLPALNVHDPDYYRGWAQRTAEYAGPWRRRLPWLDDLCARFADRADWLAAAPPAVIHGEFYPKNILVDEDTAYPVDWESAAVAAGEIDLASLTENWSEAAARECEQEYCAARWPGGAPVDFPRRLAAARMYWVFRWLGWQPDRLDTKSCARYFAQLHAAGVQLGLI